MIVSRKNNFQSKSYHNSSIAYRPEIDGLRAVAVLPVILFHAGIDIFSGGYIGVDVFFVISGYLITSIILREVEKNSFSIIRFYERRARRILPALFFVIVCCLPFAWVWMLPDELKRFGQSLIAISTFVSNIYFWKNTSYFATAAEEEPLLHTWSLAVEEQFYVLFPICLILFWRFGKRKLFWLSAIAAFASFGLAEWGWRNASSANFYLLPTRAWELLAGSLLAFLSKKTLKKFGEGRLANFGSIVGLGFITYSIFGFDKATPFPSVYTLVPVIGTILIIAHASPSNLVGKLLSTRVFVAVGLISYSAYLWHQPLLAFSKIVTLGEYNNVLTTIVLCLTLIFSTLTYKYIESPLRQESGLISTRRGLFSFSILTLLITFVVGLSFHLSEGFQTRVRSNFNTSAWEKNLAGNYGLDARCEYSELFTVQDYCTQGKNPNTILWGDSFAMHLAQGMTANGVQFIQATRSLCGPSFSDAPVPNSSVYNFEWSKKCFDFNQSVLAYLRSSSVIKFAVLASPFDQYLKGKFFNPIRGVYAPTDNERLDSFLHTINELKRIGIQPVIVSPPPRAAFNVGECLKRLDSGLFMVGQQAEAQCQFTVAFLPPETLISRNFVDDIAERSGVKKIDFFASICPDGINCLSKIESFPIYRDDGHLSEFGSYYLASRHALFKSLK